MICWKGKQGQLLNDMTTYVYKKKEETEVNKYGEVKFYFIMFLKLAKDLIMMDENLIMKDLG